MLTGNSIVQFLSKYNWVKYILFANTDLGMYVEGTPLVEGMTSTLSIVAFIGYYVKFNPIS